MALERAKVLIIDDDLVLLRGAGLMLRSTFDVLTASSVQTAKSMIRNQSIHIVIVDLNFEGQDLDGLDFIDWALHDYPDLPIVVLSGDASTQRVVSAMRRPLVNFIPKSREYEDDLRAAVSQGLELKKRRTEENFSFTFQTRSPVMKRVLEIADRVARTTSDCNVLMVGETGSGKEVLAKHFAARAMKKMTTANMASIPREMVESQLFGHARGALPGAHADQSGLLTRAHRGIFFLDELGECLPATQAKLLRAIQEKEIQPLGSSRSMKVDVQFLAATNRNLEQMVEDGTFRLDLLQRLNAVTLHLPSLRDRPEDIEFYTGLFVNEFCQEKPFAIKASGIDALLNHSWPGNTRELSNVIRKIVILSDRHEIDGDTVQAALQTDSRRPTVGSGVIGQYQEIRRSILTALEKHQGNRTRAAEALKMHPTTMFRWIKRLGIGNAIAAKTGRPAVDSDKSGEIA